MVILVKIDLFVDYFYRLFGGFHAEHFVLEGIADAMIEARIGKFAAPAVHVPKSEDQPF